MNRCKLRQVSCLVVVLSIELTGMVYAGSVKHEEKIHKTIEIKGEKRLVVESKSGDIIIRGEAGKVDVQLTIIKRVKAESQEEAERLAGLREVALVGELAAEQAVHPLSLVEEVGAHIRDQHQVGLP